MSPDPPPAEHSPDPFRPYLERDGRLVLAARRTVDCTSHCYSKFFSLVSPSVERPSF